MKHWKTRVGIYDTATLHLVLDSKIGDAQKRFKDVAEAGDAENCRGFMVYDWPNFYIFLDETIINHGTIAHEIFHTTMAIMREVGVKHAPKHDEAYAYMADWLTRWVYRKLGNRHIPANKERPGRFKAWMLSKMPFLVTISLCSAFLLAGCLNVAETPQNKPHEGMSFRCDGYEPR